MEDPGLLWPNREPRRSYEIAVVGAGGHGLATAGPRLPLQSHPLQALVSELLEPVLNCVVMSNAMHAHVSQPHKGELVMGAGIDAYNPYAQRGSFQVIEAPLGGALALLLGRQARGVRGGHADVRPDRRGGGVVGPALCDSLFAHRDVLVVGAGRAGLEAALAAGRVGARLLLADDQPALGCFDHGYAVLAEHRTTPADQRRQDLARERWRATSSPRSTRACAASCATTSRAGASGWATNPFPAQLPL
jgi:glycine/D-amino acid oxidase-like deaminating enzyme